jgi:hypothetical protein
MVIGVHKSDTDNIAARASDSSVANALTADDKAGHGNGYSQSSSGAIPSIIAKNSDIESTSSDDIPSSDDAAITKAAEQAVQYWQSSNQGIKLNSTLKEITIEAYKIHYIKNRGITRDDLVKRLKHSEKYAKRLLFECQSNNLLVPLDGHKQGRFKEYFLSTEIDKFLERQQQQQHKKGSRELSDANELSVIQILINEITQRKPTFHKIFIHFNTLPLDEKFEFDEVYQSLTEKNHWTEKSKNNMAKVKSFRLEYKRSCTIQVYPKGKVIVMVECSYRPFKLHEEEGCQQFWKSIGKIELILSQELGQTSIIPPTGEWLLKEYDRDVTIPESDFEKIPSN